MTELETSPTPAASLRELPGEVHDRLRGQCQRWLRGFRSDNSRAANAKRVGVPREWLPDTGSTERRRAERVTGYEWLVWCLRRDVPYLAPTVDDLNRWLDDLVAAGYTQRTQAAMLSSVSSFYTHLVREAAIDTNPVQRVNRATRHLRVPKNVRVRNPLTYEQVRALLEGAWLLAERSRNGRRDRAMLETLAMLGLRADELVELDRADYHRPSPGARGAMTVHGKGGKTRTVGIPVEVADAVDDYLAHRPDAGTVAHTGQPGGRARQPLFTSSTGARLHTSHVAQLLDRVVNMFTAPTPPREQWKRTLLRSAVGARVAAALSPLRGGVNPHRLRHTYGTLAIGAGASMRQVQQDLGHADLATTEGYVHDQQQADNSASHRLSPGMHQGWLTPRTAAEQARTTERDEIPGQTSIHLPETPGECR